MLATEIRHITCTLPSEQELLAKLKEEYGNRVTDPTTLQQLTQLAQALGGTTANIEQLALRVKQIVSPDSRQNPKDVLMDRIHLANTVVWHVCGSNVVFEGNYYSAVDVMLELPGDQA